MNKRFFLGISSLLISILVVACSPKAAEIPTVEVAKPTETIKPAEPSEPDRTLEDANSSLKSYEKRAVTGDIFINNVFERPFTSNKMDYLPDVDILTASIFTDANFHYFTIQLAGVNQADKKLSGTYGIEFDLNKDGRGDYLVTGIDPKKEWSTENVKIYTDPDGDVGGPRPIVADLGFIGKGNGYEKTLDNSSSAFMRLDPENEAAIQFAIIKQLLGDPKEFLWGAWADESLRNPQMLDYNDQFNLEEAGSPLKSDPNYPLKALFAVDNTCRVSYGFSTIQSIPGMCVSHVVEEPGGKVPKKPVTPGRP